MKLKNVLVTGASTGIGRSIAEHLSTNGFHVFAGARKDENINELSKIHNVTGIKIDVTNKSEIEASVKQIEKSGGLFALVNNAGIASANALIEMSEERYNFQLEVNLVASNRLVQYFFEQLRTNKGRVVNISSLNGFVTSPFGGAYAITKFGLLAYSEQLRAELKKFSIQVSCVEPGYFHSAIFEKADATRAETAARTEYYKEEWGAKRSTKMRDDNIKDPIQVAERVLHSLTTEKPHKHYTVGNKTEEGWSFQALFNRIVEVNQGLAEPWSFEVLQKIFEKVNKGEIEL